MLFWCLCNVCFRMDHKQKQQIPPRIYCDICEEFDLHDTDDCPKQESDFPQVNMEARQKRDLPERAYCEVCEGEFSIS